jgi:predicted nucleotidyltransferase
VAERGGGEQLAAAPIGVRLERLAHNRSSWLRNAQPIFEADQRVSAVWLVGSLGRGTEDAFSDVDAVVVLPDELADRAFASRDDVDQFGTVTLINPAGQNGPAGGNCVGVLYDMDGLPLCVDFHIWPHSWATRPSDARVLWELAEETLPTAEASFSDLLEARPRRAGSRFTVGERGLFELMMLSISLKYFARGYRDQGLVSLVGRGGNAAGGTVSLGDLGRILLDLKAEVPDAAWQCVSNLFDVVRDLSESNPSGCDGGDGAAVRPSTGSKRTNGE